MEKTEVLAKMAVCLKKAGMRPRLFALDEDEDGELFFDADGFFGIRVPEAPYTYPFPYKAEDIVAVKYRSARREEERQNNEFDLGYVVFRFATGEDFYFLSSGDYTADIIVEGRLRYFGTAQDVFARYAEMREAIRWGVADYDIQDGALLSYNGDAQVCLVPEGLHRIAPFAFSWGSPKVVILPSTLRSIEQNAFEFCADLERVEWNDGLERIAYQAFRGCTSLAEVSLPKSVQEIEDEAFVESGVRAFLCYADTKVSDTAFADTPYAQTL